jgi:hypothetical protein
MPQQEHVKSSVAGAAFTAACPYPLNHAPVRADLTPTSQHCTCKCPKVQPTPWG